MQSMDGTALIACAILLEEACKEALGQTGDLVFTEPQPDEYVGKGAVEGLEDESSQDTKRIKRDASDFGSTASVDSNYTSDDTDIESLDV